jgi:peptidoglycan-N-acetylglucosamine deacetylase
MGISLVPGEMDSDPRSRTINKRVMLMIVLSVLLMMLGSITFTVFAFWEKTPSYKTPPTSITTHTRSSTPTQTTVHAPVLTYPLFNGNTHIPEIALTFDDGPNPFYTPQVLAMLQQYGVKATFFDVGYLVADFPNIVRQEYNQGNIVANHSWSHPVLTSLSVQAIHSQLTSTTNIIQATIGVRPTFFRPPYGSINNTVLAQARNLRYTTVLWDGSAGDWKLPGVHVIVNETLSYARNGAILLLHDGGGNRAQTVAALPIIIATLKNRGFKFVTIQQLVDDLGMPLAQNANNKIQHNTTISLIAAAIFTVWRRETFYSCTIPSLAVSL